MKLTFTTKELWQAFGALSIPVTKKPKSPLYVGFVVKSPHTVEFFTSDPLFSVRVTLEMAIVSIAADEPVEYCLDYEPIKAFLKGKSNLITFSHNVGDDYLKLSNDFWFYLQIQLVDNSQLPKLPDAGQRVGYVENLSEAVKSVAFAASSDVTRPVLTGVNFQVKENKFYVAACNGERLQVMGVDTDIPDPFNVILPADLLSKVVKSSPQSVRVAFFKTETVFNDYDIYQNRYVTSKHYGYWLHFGNFSYHIVEIKGNYPNVRQLIPKEITSNNVTCITSDVKDILKFVYDNCSKTPHHYNAEFQLTGNKCFYLFINPSGQWTVPQEMQGVKSRIDTAVAFLFDCKYLIEALDTVGTDTFNLCFDLPLKDYLAIQNDEDIHRVLMGKSLSTGLESEVMPATREN